MSVERTESLEMYRGFYNENPFATGMEGVTGILNAAGLSTFIKEAKTMMEESSPFFLQASTLFTHYRREISSLYTETLNTEAASQLLEKFGVAGIGIGKDGNANEKITAQILETHSELAKNAEETSIELPLSVQKILAFITTMQREIVRMLISSQENQLSEIVAVEKEEKKVEEHLSAQSQRNNVVVYESVTDSRKEQAKRVKNTEEEEEGILSKLNNMITFAGEMLKPAQAGTMELARSVVRV